MKVFDSIIKHFKDGINIISKGVEDVLDDDVRYLRRKIEPSNCYHDLYNYEYHKTKDSISVHFLKKKGWVEVDKEEFKRAHPMRNKN